MYITNPEVFSLDIIVKSFEVAFRSFIVEALHKKFPDESTFNTFVSGIASTQTPTMFSHKIQSKINELKKEPSKKYKTISDTYKSYQTKTFDNNVPYVSELVDYIIIFFNPCFSQKDLVHAFSSVEEFHYIISTYHKIRNTLSHPASRPINEQDAHRIIYFVKKATQVLNDKFFWYCSKKTILSYIEDYYKISKTSTIKVTNLYSSRIQHKRLLCRDDELKKLGEYILGNANIKRLSGSVVLYGYGGVGKTALVLEFLQRLVVETKEREEDIEFVLFYSSKEEYLGKSITTGDFYIENIEPEFENLADLLKLIKEQLKIQEIGEIADKYKRGIIVIDNIENIQREEKDAIYKFIKGTPRNIQYIITSRDEEPCEDKIPIEGFKDADKGSQFIDEYIESEDLVVDISDQEKLKLVEVSRGNALILVQALTLISEKVVTIDDVSTSLYNMRSKNVEIIANFMYKNTFDSVIAELNSLGYKVKEVINVISLYDEPIELYSISKLAEIDISAADIVCKKLSQRLILNKTGEHYLLNEFAKRFVFIKLLPSREEVIALKEKIRGHKLRIGQKLQELQLKIAQNQHIKEIVDDWQPKNYIDKVIMAELFSLYEAAYKSVKQGKEQFEACLSEINEHELISSHPYVSFQKARILKLGLGHYKDSERNDLKKKIERSFEDAIESLEYDHLHIKGTKSHGSILMLFGVFLSEELNDNKRAVRFLEEGKDVLEPFGGKSLFICLNYLCRTYERLYKASKDDKIMAELKQNILKVCGGERDTQMPGIDIDRFKRKYLRYVK